MCTGWTRTKLSSSTLCVPSSRASGGMNATSTQWSASDAMSAREKKRLRATVPMLTILNVRPSLVERPVPPVRDREGGRAAVRKLAA